MRGRRLAWISNRWRWCPNAQMAMYLLHFSAVSSLFSFWESLLKRNLAEGETYGKKNSKLPSLWQNPLPRSLGKTKNRKQKHGQMPWVRKHKELEGRKTSYSLWSNSEILLLRLRPQVFISLVPKIFSFSSLWQLGGFHS